MASYSVQYIFTLLDRFTPGAARMGAAAAAMSKKVHAAGAAMGTFARRATLMTAAVAALGTMFVLTGVKKAAAFENAMANVRRVTDISRQEMLEYGKDVLRIGVDTAQTGEDIADVMAQGAMMGIRGQKPLAAFAETVAKVAVAWDDISKDVAASQIARLSAKFFGDLNPDEQVAGIKAVADAINELSNRSAFKAPELLKFFDRGAAAAKRFGLTAQQAAAYGGSALVLGEPTGELQGTRARMTFQRLLDAATKPVESKKGLTKLGQSFQALGMTQNQFKEVLANDPQAAILEIMERMQGLDKFAQQKVADGMLDARSSAQFLSIVQNLNEYKRQLAIADDKWAGVFAQDSSFMNWLSNAGEGHKELFDQLVKYNRVASRTGSVQREFGKRTETLTFAWRQFGLAIDRVQILSAMPLLEPLRNIVNGFSDAAMAVGDFMEKNQSLSNYLMTGVGGAALIGLGAGLMGVAKWATGLTSTLAVLKGFGLLTFQFAIIAAGIATAYWIYDNWERLKQLAAEPLQFSAIFPEAPEWLKDFWSKGTNMAAWGKEKAGEVVDAVLPDIVVDAGSAMAGTLADMHGKVQDYIASSLLPPAPERTSSFDNIVNAEAYRKAEASNESAARQMSVFDRFKDFAPPEKSWFGTLNTSYDDIWGTGSVLARGNPRFNEAIVPPQFNMPAPPSAPPQFSESRVPQAVAVQVQTQAHTSFDPATIQVNVTGTLSGTVNGPAQASVNGNGSGQVSARPSRGEASASAGAANAGAPATAP